MGIQNRNGALFLATGIDNSGLYSGFNDAEKRIDQFEAHIKRMGDNLTRLTGVGLGVAGLKTFGSEIINVYGEMQMLQSSFEVLLGGKGVAGFTSELKKFAVDSPLSLGGVSQAAQTLLGFGIAAEKVMPTVKQMGDISMGSEEKFKSLTLAFAQMSATGKLMGQDLLQMINAGFNPLMTISEKTGKSIGDLKKDMENGAISSQMVADAFASATAEGGKFYGMTQKQAEGIKGLQAQLEGGLQDAYNKIGQSQEGLIAGGYKVSIALVENYQAIGEALTALIATYGLYKAATVFNTSIDKTVTVMRYEAEIAELTKLLPLKEQEANADLKAAVASGKLTQSKAEQLIALRAEIESRKESIQSKLAEEQINLKSLEARRLESVEAIKRAQAKTAAAKEELANTIATAEAEKVASLQKRMSLESERQSRAALRIIKLQEEKDAAIEQARALKESQASAEKVAAKNREIASIHAKIAVAREEEIQHGRNVSAMRNEIKAGVDVTANKKIQALTNKVNTLSEKENAAATAQTGYAKQIVGKRVLIKKLATDAETISNKINTAEQNINTTSTNFLAVAKNRAAAAAKNLWAALAPNPYVLAAAAAVALGYGIYKLATAATAAEQAQAALNKETERTAAKADDERTAIERLLGIMKDEVSTRNEKQKALETLQSKYPSIFSNLDIEKIKNLDLADAIRQVNIELEKRAGVESKANIDRAKEILKGVTDWDGVSFKTNKDIKDAKDLVGLDGIWERNTTTNSKLKQMLEEYVSQAENKLLNDVISADKASFNALPKNERIASLKKDVDELQAQRDRLKKLDEDQKRNPFSGGLSMYGPQLEAVEKQINIKNTEINKIEKDTENTISKNKAHWEKIKKDAEDARDVLDESEKGSKKWLELTATIQKAESKLKLWGSPTKAGSEAESAAEKAQKLAQKQADARIKGYNDLERADLDHYNATLENQQNSLNLLEDGFEKEQQLLDINLDKSVLAAQKRVRDLIEKQQQAEEDAWKAGGSKGVFTPSTQSSDDLFKINPGAKTEYNESLKIAKSTYDKGMGDLYKSQLAMYQDYSAKRVAIEKKFNDDILSLQKAKEQAEKEGNKELVDQLNRSVAQATKEKGESLITLDFEQLKKTPEYVRAFENLNNTSTETLNSLLAQLEQAKQAAVHVLTPDQLREYTSTIESIMDELVSRDLFGAIAELKREVVQADKELIEAEKQYNDVVSGKDTSITVTQALLNLNAAKDKSTKKTNQLKGAEKELSDQISQLGKEIENVGNAIGGTVGEIISLMGSITSTVTFAIDGMKAVAATGAAAISTVEKASVILAIISAALQIATKIASLFAADYSEYNKAKEAYESYISVLDKVIEKQKELVETMTGENARNSYEYALELIKKQEAAARELGKQRLDSGASAGSHSIGVRIRKRMSQEGWNQAAQVLGKDFGWATDGRMTGLFDLSIEQLKELQEKAPSFWAQLDGDVQNYLNSIIESEKAIEDMRKILQESVTQVSFDSFRDSFLDTLLDMNSDAKDFANDFEKYLQKSMLNSLLKEKFDDQIRALYGSFSKYGEDNINEAEYAALQKQKDDLVNEMIKERDKMKDLFDWTSDSDTSQSSSRGGFETITQDQAGSIDGRLTGMHETDIRTEQNTLQLILLASERNSILKGYTEGFMSIRNVLVESMFLLQEIRDSNNELYDIREDIAYLRKNGIKIA